MAENEDELNAPLPEQLHALLDEPPPDALPLSAGNHGERRKDGNRDSAVGAVEARRSEQDVPKRLLVFASEQGQYRLGAWVAEQGANQFGLLVAAERQAFNEQDVLEIHHGGLSDVHQIVLSNGCTPVLPKVRGT